MADDTPQVAKKLDRNSVGKCSWQLAVGSWQLAVGSWQLAVGSWLSSENGNREP
jgi:hypothetical protein